MQSTMTNWAATITVSELYESYEAGLRHFAQNLTNDSDWADDLVSQTMMKAMINLPVLARMNTYQHKAWLYRVLKNQFIDQLRKNKNELRLAEQFAQMEIESQSFELPQTLNTDMPAHHRKILHLRYELGLSSDEIGQLLAIPPATARSRLRLAVQWIKKHHNNGE